MEFNEKITPDSPTWVLHLSAHRVAKMRAEIAREVERARRAGASWSEIGAALGMTRQAAQKRFGAS